MASRDTNILILCKTYPSPSAKYCETSCVAGMEEDGSLIRLFPVPFRLIDGKQQFKKWQWISAKVEKSRDDHRPESHRLQVGSIEPGAEVTTRRDWSERRHYINRIEIFDSPGQLEAARVERGVTLGLVRVGQVLDLSLTESKNDSWTENELAKLVRLQTDLFEDDQTEIRQLEKIPVDFHYHYECDTADGPVQFKHKVVDWEVCSLYRNLVQAHGKQGWKEPFKRKLLDEFPKKDLMFLMGTIHRFPDQWLIVSLIYPPKEQQPALF
ncbi:hypothetical protein [Chromohalobacter israelensis]|uniref:hypothetical protein n=1 Tax=Chromohalobacter israelensis TaxID=141390 RepID=UPI0015C463DF|nr:hypothetical protein [Chromohalobacter salexigens]MBZ5876298.1 hypothetical protein [Chromohalobacter salexigens]NWO55526.1 hypothetical protein [Chromohalobacter salexigens]